MTEVQSQPSFHMESQMSTVSTSSTASFYYVNLGKVVFLKIHFTTYLLLHQIF